MGANLIFEVKAKYLIFDLHRADVFDVIGFLPRVHRSFALVDLRRLSAYVSASGWMAA